MTYDIYGSKENRAKTTEHPADCLCTRCIKPDQMDRMLELRDELGLDLSVPSNVVLLKEKSMGATL